MMVGAGMHSLGALGQGKTKEGRVRAFGPLSGSILQFSQYEWGQSHFRKHLLHSLSLCLQLPTSFPVSLLSLFPFFSCLSAPSSRYLGGCAISQWHPEGMSHCVFYFNPFSSVNLLLSFFMGTEQEGECEGFSKVNYISCIDISSLCHWSYSSQQEHVLMTKKFLSKFLHFLLSLSTMGDSPDQ